MLDQIHLLGTFQLPYHGRDTVGFDQNVYGSLGSSVLWVQVGLEVVPQGSQQGLNDFETHRGLVGGGGPGVQIVEVAQASLLKAAK